jgi:hypothetical protein
VAIGRVRRLQGGQRGLLRQIGQSMPTLATSPVFEIADVAAGIRSRHWQRFYACTIVNSSREPHVLRSDFTKSLSEVGHDFGSGSFPLGNQAGLFFDGGHRIRLCLNVVVDRPSSLKTSIALDWRLRKPARAN